MDPLNVFINKELLLSNINIELDFCDKIKLNKIITSLSKLGNPSKPTITVDDWNIIGTTGDVYKDISKKYNIPVDVLESIIDKDVNTMVYRNIQHNSVIEYINRNVN